MGFFLTKVVKFSVYCGRETFSAYWSFLRLFRHCRKVL